MQAYMVVLCCHLKGCNRVLMLPMSCTLWSEPDSVTKDHWSKERKQHEEQNLIESLLWIKL